MNSQKDSTTGRIPPRWVRILVLLFMLFCIGIFSIGVFVTFRYAYRYPEAFTANSWSVEAMSRLIDQVGLTFQGWSSIQLALGLVTAACYCIVGGFIYARK